MRATYVSTRTLLFARIRSMASRRRKLENARKLVELFRLNNFGIRDDFDCAYEAVFMKKRQIGQGFSERVRLRCA
jgi:hypothetical protein